MHKNVKEMAKAAKAAAGRMAMASTEQKNKALKDLIVNIQNDQERILEANRQDIALAEAQGMRGALLERLSLKNRLEGIIHDIGQVIELDDPIGENMEEHALANHLRLTKSRTPIGVLGVIYESRPNVTIDISALCIKSGNCAILRGGSDTLHTNRVWIELISKSLVEVGLPIDAIQCITSADRNEVKEMLVLHDYIDLIIPRGNTSLQQFCREHSTVPVITGGIGICHLFVDEMADLERSLEVIFNAKTQRPSVCNALDTLLVHAAIAVYFIPKVVDLLKKAGVSFRLDRIASQCMQDPSCTLAGSQDWDTEWLSLILGIKVVSGVEEAIEHVQRHSTGHSDGILTEDAAHAQAFIKAVDSAAVYVNASTRFTDGGQFGLGAEVAISTQKLHARGPMGLKELTTYKWIINGEYHVRKG